MAMDDFGEKIHIHVADVTINDQGHFMIELRNNDKFFSFRVAIDQEEYIKTLDHLVGLGVIVHSRFYEIGNPSVTH
jgi:hypothetical protein